MRTIRLLCILRHVLWWLEAQTCFSPPVRNSCLSRHLVHPGWEGPDHVSPSIPHAFLSDPPSSKSAAAYGSSSTDRINHITKSHHNPRIELDNTPADGAVGLLSRASIQQHRKAGRILNQHLYHPFQASSRKQRKQRTTETIRLF